MTIRHVIMTGGSGYIGSTLAKYARAHDICVTLLGRREHIPWSLGDPLPANAIDDRFDVESQAVIHLAHDWRNSVIDGEDTNIVGTRLLLLSCRSYGLRHFVFASSQSARQDAINVYGRVKWQIEREFVQKGEVSARIGLVYGGRPQAMYGLLCQLVKLTPVLPMVDPWRKVQPIHVSEVCDGLIRLCERTDHGWFGLASGSGLPFGELLQTFAKELYGKRLYVIPVALRLALATRDTLAMIPALPKIDRERILGLAGTQPMDCQAHLQTLGLTVAPLAERLRQEPQSRRAALSEGRLILAAILRQRPKNELLRRYVSLIKFAEPPGPLALPWGARARGSLLEPFGGTSDLSKRMKLATTLAEASSNATLLRSRFGLLKAILGDALILPFRVVLRLWYR
jgi:nucleoside-diphosphate-sugar epimerase